MLKSALQYVTRPVLFIHAAEIILNKLKKKRDLFGPEFSRNIGIQSTHNQIFTLSENIIKLI